MGKVLRRSSCVFGALLMMSTMSFAGSSIGKMRNTTGGTSSGLNFHDEATGLLTGIESDATQIRMLASELDAVNKNLFVNWSLHADHLNMIRSAVNDMGSKLSRLEAIRSTVLPWQQRAIDRVAPLVRLTADNTEDAILFLNANHGRFWQPEYGKYAQNLYTESGQITSAVREFEEYANARQTEMQLGRTLGMSSGS